MKRVLFISTAIPNLKHSDIKSILTASKVNTQQSSVTGIFIYDEVHFIDCLEGDGDIVDEMLQRIKEDKRHYDIKILGEKEISERCFEQWNIAFLNSTKKTVETFVKVLGATYIDKKTLTYEKAIKLIKTLHEENLLVL